MYIILTGLHPFDLYGKTPDKELRSPHSRNSAVTAHLSHAIIEVIEKLMEWGPATRLSAMQILNHAWAKGKNACTTKMADSDKKLSTYRRFQSSLERKMLEDIVQWSDHTRKSHTTHPDNNEEQVMRNTSLVERAFRSLDPQKKGYLTTHDLQRANSVNDTEGQEGL
jgi:serine/threonine protein kinase